MNLQIRRFSYGSPEYELALKLRTQVLRDPLGLKFTEAELAMDRDDIHIGAFSGDRILGCLILTRKSESAMKMRQVAVAPEAQGMGIGKKMVLFSEELAAQAGCSEISLAARDTAVPFYQALNYEMYGEPFLEVGIPHRWMKKKLYATKRPE